MIQAGHLIDSLSTPQAQRLAHPGAMEVVVFLKSDGTLPPATHPEARVDWSVGEYDDAQGNYCGFAPYLVGLLLRHGTAGWVQAMDRSLRCWSSIRVHLVSRLLLA